MYACRKLDKWGLSLPWGHSTYAHGRYDSWALSTMEMSMYTCGRLDRRGLSLPGGLSMYACGRLDKRWLSLHWGIPCMHVEGEIVGGY